MDRRTITTDAPSDPRSTETYSRASTSAHLDSTNRDSISIKNLQLPFGVIAPDVWGKAKEQPALVSIHLVLNGGFASASSKDELDDSTIHYGILAKNIRKSCREGQTAGDLSYNVENIIVSMARRKESGRFCVAKSSVEVNLPKASMFGDFGITLINETRYSEEGKVVSANRVFSLRGVKIMTLIGVNSYERSNTQPLVVDILLHLRSEAQQTMDSNATVALFNLEQMLVEVIKQTAFETLETLAEFTITQLRKKMLDAMLPGTRVQLRIEKPRAIPWADAPAVEITRDVPSAKRSTRVGSTVTAFRPSSSAAHDSPASAEPKVLPGVRGSGLVVNKPYLDN